MLFKTSHLVSTWTRDTLWRVAVKIFQLLIFFLMLWNTLSNA